MVESIIDFVDGNERSMITKLTLKNFKNVDEQTYEFRQFDLLVGRNNSGKSTVLQALAIWQFCVDEFHLTKRTGSKGIQVVLPNFTALPLPEFNLLWKDRTDRHWPSVNGTKKQEYILINIVLDWRTKEGNEYSFGVELRYHSAQTMYAIPAGGWADFVSLDKLGVLPRIAYVPPFSGLEPIEKWMDKGNIREQVGKAQPGSVLRNLLLQVFTTTSDSERTEPTKDRQISEEWRELTETVRRWFSVNLIEPNYRQGIDTRITVEYRQDGKRFDIISGGSGFHQTLTLLAFLYGYNPTTILMDEPDAHLHVNLQRAILDYFKKKSAEKGVQFLIATHAEEFARGVDASQIVSLLKRAPTRVQSTPEVLRAMAEVSNEEITQLMTSKLVLYVEGESDERIIRGWAIACNATNVMDTVYFKTMSGGDKIGMQERANNHFSAIRQIKGEAKRLMLFDYDSDESAFHPEPNNNALFEWKRKNIENYLLVPEAWKRALFRQMNCLEDDLFCQSSLKVIDDFFIDQNLTLPPGRQWKSVAANIFSAVDGKRILFEDNDSLFQKLRRSNPSVTLIREDVAAAMTDDEIHDDVCAYFSKLLELAA